MTSTQDYESVGRGALDEAERRAPRFLKVLSTNARIRALLDAAGYGTDVHAEGYRLYFKVVGYAPPIAAPIESATKGAIAAIEAWQVSGFARARAALRHKHPDVERFVFAGLTASRGPEALGTMAAFLERCDALESATSRKSTRKEDHAALATLSRRGITTAVRTHLREQLRIATVEAEVAPVLTIAPSDVTERKQDLHALYMWLQDWSETARAVVSLRGDLIRLGIAKRRRGKGIAVVPPVVPVVPAPVVAPAAAGNTNAEEEENGPASRAA